MERHPHEPFRHGASRLDFAAKCQGRFAPDISSIGRKQRSTRRKFAESALDTLEQLIEFPYLGSPQFFSHPQLRGIRQWPVQNFKTYVILYRPFASNNGLEVLRVLHGARDIKTHLEGALDED